MSSNVLNVKMEDDFIDNNLLQACKKVFYNTHTHTHLGTVNQVFVHPCYEYDCKEYSSGQLLHL